MESRKELTEMAGRIVKEEGTEKPLAVFLYVRGLLRGYLEVLRDQEAEIRERINNYDSRDRGSPEFLLLASNWMRIAGQVRALELFLRGKSDV